MGGGSSAPDMLGVGGGPVLGPLQAFPLKTRTWALLYAYMRLAAAIRQTGTVASNVSLNAGQMMISPDPSPRPPRRTASKDAVFTVSEIWGHHQAIPWGFKGDRSLEPPFFGGGGTAGQGGLYFFPRPLELKCWEPMSRQTSLSALGLPLTTRTRLSICICFPKREGEEEGPNERGRGGGGGVFHHPDPLFSGGGGGGRHQQEHRPQRPTESSDPTQHAKGRTGDCPGLRKETTRRNVTRGVNVECLMVCGVNPPPPFRMTRSLNSGNTVQKFPGVVVIGACVSLFAWGLGLRRGRFIWLACSGEHGGSLYTGGSF